jgi:hypothetical protein
MSSLTGVWWRDIPAQVIAGTGRGAARRQLGDRFQEAIDAAAMRAGLIGTDAYLEQWRRESRACGDDLEAEVDAEAAKLEAAYADDVLERLVRAGGAAAETTTPVGAGSFRPDRGSRR